MANNKNVLKQESLNLLLQDVNRYPRFQRECVPRCALRDMFQFQLKCGVYANLIKKDLDMMDYGMKK